MNIRVIEKLNSDHIIKLHELYQNEWFTEGRSLDDVKKMLNHTDFVFGICERDTDELMGFARVISDHVYKAFVFDVIVAPPYRSKGLGKLMMETIFNHPKLSNVPHIELYCPEPMVAFYEKLGFNRRTSLLLRKTNSHGK
jgi:GNAT superfamily N-acetyltransferase